MAKKEASAAKKAQAQELERIKERFDLLDHRLDNIDSVVSAVAERVMMQPISFSLSCPHCGKNIEIAIIGSEKPTR